MPKQEIKTARYLLLVILFSVSVPVFSKGNFDEDIYANYFEIADGYAEIKNYDKAIYFYDKASKSDIYKNASKYNMARMHALKQSWKDAVKLLAELYKSDPENRLVYTAYAYAITASGDFEKGCKMYEAIYKSETENPEATINYIRILIVAKKYDKARKILEDGMLKFTGDEEKKKLDALNVELTQMMNPPQ